VPDESSDPTEHVVDMDSPVLPSPAGSSADAVDPTGPLPEADDQDPFLEVAAGGSGELVGDQATEEAAELGEQPELSAEPEGEPAEVDELPDPEVAADPVMEITEPAEDEAVPEEPAVYKPIPAFRPLLEEKRGSGLAFERRPVDKDQILKSQLLSL
jgi:hypothetical protein